jgi:predicted nucleic acid-binding Zn ribbon protein
MRRQVSAPSISFSGGGWYAQGYSGTPPCKADKPGGKTAAPDTGSAAKGANGTNGAKGTKGACENCMCNH